METKMLSSNSAFLSRFKDKFHVYQVDCSTTGGGRAGGLLMLWNYCNVVLTIIDENSNYIDMHITSNNIQWRATGLYGFPQANNKFLTCDLINELATNNNNHNWLLFGDFNIITNNGEKMGGNAYDHNIMSLFYDTINNCALQDLGYEGEIFTWTNRQDDNQHIKARLDRFLASEDWITTFPSYQNTHLIRYSSNHCPILLEFSANHTCRKTHKNNKIQR
jgi:hypothetical protein